MPAIRMFSKWGRNECLFTQNSMMLVIRLRKSYILTSQEKFEKIIGLTGTKTSLANADFVSDKG